MRSLLAALILFAAPLAAQTLTLGPDIPVAPAGGGAGDQTRVAASPDGGFAVIWKGTQLFLRAFGADGAPLSGAVQLSSPGPGLTAQYARIAALASGGYVVVWAEIDALPFEPLLPPRVTGRIVDASGQPAGPEFLSLPGDNYPDVAAYPSGGFVLTWISQQSSQLFARRFDGSGAPVSGEVVLPERGEQIATLPDGGFALASVRYRAAPGDGFDSDVVFRIFGPDLLPAGPEVPVHGTGVSDHTDPQISSDATGRFVIAWNAGQQVRARVFGPDGTAQSPEITVHTGSPAGGGNFPFAVALRTDGSFLVLWGNQANLFARWLRPDGTPAGEPFAFQDNLGFQLDGDAEPTATGWIVSWSNSESASDGPHVRRLFLPCDGLCLNGNRFRATVTWHISSRIEGIGTPIPLTGDTGAFWFFQPSNYELAVKVLDGRGVNGHFWVFYASLTNVEFDLTVTDTVTGQERTYHNSFGTLASQADTEAF